MRDGRGRTEREELPSLQSLLYEAGLMGTMHRQRACSRSVWGLQPPCHTHKDAKLTAASIGLPIQKMTTKGHQGGENTLERVQHTSGAMGPAPYLPPDNA